MEVGRRSVNHWSVVQPNVKLGAVETARTQFRRQIQITCQKSPRGPRGRVTGKPEVSADLRELDGRERPDVDINVTPRMGVRIWTKDEDMHLLRLNPAQLQAVVNALRYTLEYRNRAKRDKQ